MRAAPEDDAQPQGGSAAAPAHENRRDPSDKRSNAGTSTSSPPPEPRLAALTPGPVTHAERIRSLDTLRGVALLGILVMNIQAFSMVFAAYFNPHAYGDLSGANYLVWLLSHIFADRKFMTIFSMLFGAGILLMTTRREAAGGRSAGLHYRRMLVLLGFGLLHAYLIWDGDILVTYALCGMVVYPFRRCRPGTLLGLSVLLISVGAAITLFFQWSMQFWTPEMVQGLRDSVWAPPPEQIEASLRLHRGSWLGMLPARAASSLFMQTYVFLTECLWRVSGLMLAGMALLKLGWFSAVRSRGAYLVLTLIGLIVGLPLIVGGMLYEDTVNWDIGRCFYLASEFNYWGSIPLALAWVGAVMLASRSGVLSGVCRVLASVGQMAFTNYLLQSIICTLLFNGYGLGWFGRVERVGQFGIVLGVWAFQLILSPLWLRRFRFGPAEWLWRALTYGRLPPFRR